MIHTASAALAALVLVSAPLQETRPVGEAAPPSAAAPAELFTVERVVDGDTIWIQRGDRREKLRLLSVDTEEKLSFEGSASKPGTVFGQETSLWAQEFFGELAEDGEPARVGLAFPDGIEARDVYGRLLCHVILPDGTDFNVLLVREGKSPYFTKYGSSRICHERFVAAQAEAREREIGIWDPATNAPATPGAPSARRDYDRLIPWWNLRAAAVDGFRAEALRDPLHRVAADDGEGLERALREARDPVRVFGLVDRVFDEEDGSRTVLMRSGDKQRALRLVVPAERRGDLEEIDFGTFNGELRQNYVWVTGRLEPGGERGGFRIGLRSPADVSVAEPSTLAAPAGSDGPKQSDESAGPTEAVR